MLRGGFVIPIVAIVAIVGGIAVWQLANGQQAVSTLAPPTAVTAAPVAGQQGTIDVTWRWDDIRTGPDLRSVEMGVLVNGEPVSDVDRELIFGDPSDPNKVYTSRIAGLPCNTTVSVTVGAYETDTPVLSAPVQTSTGPCTPNPTVPPTAPPTATSTPPPPTITPTVVDMPPPIITMTEPKEEAFVVHFEYPTEGSVVPTEFAVLVNGVIYERTPYTGTHTAYSRFVSDQPCGQTFQVQIQAVNGTNSSPSEVAQAQTEPC